MIAWRQYKNFLNGRNFYEGLKVTTGIVTPAILFSLAGHVQYGLFMSLGALCVSTADGPGPVKHRFNAMLLTSVLIGLLAIFTSYISPYSKLLGIFIFLSGFFFSMLHVYGQRASSVGIAALLIVVLSMENSYTGSKTIQYGLLVMAGGVWYLLFSLLLNRFRPYKIIQQVLGDFIIHSGEYLQTRARFYDPGFQADGIYSDLFKKQVQVQAEQDLVSELLFKTRSILKESTNTSRRLIKIYIDMNDLLGLIMSVYRNYQELHDHFGNSGLLQQCQAQIILLSESLKSLGLQIKAGQTFDFPEHVADQMAQLKNNFEQYRLGNINSSNFEHFVGISGIIRNLQQITERINLLSYYSNEEHKLKRSDIDTDHINPTETQSIRPDLFLGNLNFKSSIFRHSLRVAIALVIGYGLSLWLHLTNNYWILLTIIVILKPAYSQSSKRNRDRLFGTLIGLIAGVAILYYIRDKNVLLAILIVLMIATFSLLRTNYFLAVLCMTPYLVIYFFLLTPSKLDVLLYDRMLDTFIGSAISMVAMLFIIPDWEYRQMKGLFSTMVSHALDYYYQISGILQGKTNDIAQLQMEKRQLMTSLSNVSDSFTRMLSEPKTFRKNAKDIHRLLALSHLLTSHLSTIHSMIHGTHSDETNLVLKPLESNTVAHLANTIQILNGNTENALPSDGTAEAIADDYLHSILKKRREEIKQGLLETETKKTLIREKSITDQYIFIQNISREIEKLALKL